MFENHVSLLCLPLQWRCLPLQCSMFTPSMAMFVYPFNGAAIWLLGGIADKVVFFRRAAAYRNLKIIFMNLITSPRIILMTMLPMTKVNKGTWDASRTSHLAVGWCQPKTVVLSPMAVVSLPGVVILIWWRNSDFQHESCVATQAQHDNVTKILVYHLERQIGPTVGENTRGLNRVIDLIFF